MRTLINADHRKPNKLIDSFDCLFADPPDNINLGYDGYDDRLPIPEYRAWLRRMVWDFTELAPIVWLSFNSRWTSAVGRFVDEFLIANDDWADSGDSIGAVNDVCKSRLEHATLDELDPLLDVSFLA